jgi:NitT/TauT family transport system ATP-binding protein
MAGARGSVRLREVSLRYDTGTLAVDRFDLDVAPGSFVALLGPSGCGKSSVLRLVAGLRRPSGGSLERGAEGERTAFVFQEPTLLPWKTVEANVALPLRLQGESRVASTPVVAEALERVGLSAFAGHYPRELSGGMRMRASIARAIVSAPQVLLLDEPFAALDEMTRQRLQEDLLALHAALGFTVLFVTHSVFEAVYLADRVVVTTGRPARVAADLRIDLPRPRPADTRSSPGFSALVGEVGARLREQQP